tara:strand:- start:6465 stop:6854 length:390 start_codon:yes stop_codon:yes gene_type:complete
MHFQTLLLTLFPLLAFAHPPLSPRDSTPSTYTYTFPTAYIAAYPDTPATVTLDSAQLAKAASLLPIEVTPANEIVPAGDVDVQHIKGIVESEDEMSTQAPDPRCATCLAACLILSVLGPEAVLPCSKFN